MFKVRALAHQGPGRIGAGASHLGLGIGLRLGKGRTKAQVDQVEALLIRAARLPQQEILRLHIPMYIPAAPANR